MPTAGDTSAGTGSFPASGDRALVDRIVMPEDGTLLYGYIYFDATSTGANCKFLIYSDDGADEPDALETNSAGVTVPNGGGWVQFALSGTLVAGDWWIGGVSDNFQHRFGEDDPATDPPDVKMANGTLSYSSPNATWPGSDASYSGVRLNAYVEYDVAGVVKRTMMLMGVG